MRGHLDCAVAFVCVAHNHDIVCIIVSMYMYISKYILMMSPPLYLYILYLQVLFELARFHAPSTIFMDELESIMGQRGFGVPG